MSNENLVECGCINPIACDECKGTGVVRVKKHKTIEVRTDQVVVTDLASPSTRKGSYL
jgi:hypothetical protein